MRDPRSRTYFYLGCLWSALICIVLVVGAILWLLWWYFGPS